MSREATPPAEIAASQVDSGGVDDRTGLDAQSATESGPDRKDGGAQDLRLQGDSTRTDLNPLMAVNTPIPRGTTAANNYFRTQYLNKLGIWASKQAKHHLNSAPRTEARYKSNLGSEAASSNKVTGDSPDRRAKDSKSPASAPTATTTGANTPVAQEDIGTTTTTTTTTTTPITPSTAAASASPESSPQPQPQPPPLSTTLTDARPECQPEDANKRSIGSQSPLSSPKDDARNNNSDSGGRGSGPILWPRVAGSDGGRQKLRQATAVVGGTTSSSMPGETSSAGVTSQAESAAATEVTAIAVATASAAPAAVTVRPCTGSVDNAANATAAAGSRPKAPDGSRTATSLDAQRRARGSRQQQPPQQQTLPFSLPPPLSSSSSSPTSPVAIASPLRIGTTTAAPAFPASAASSSIRSTSSSSSSGSSSTRTGGGSSAGKAAWSPPLRAVKPPRRDIRRDYLTNLGMKKAVVAGPGGTRTPPPMIRRSSFTQSVENPVEEQLKDPNSGDISFEDVLRVVGSILTGGGGGGKKEREPRPCRTCERLKKENAADDGRSSSSSSPLGRRLSSASSAHEEGEAVAVETPCRHKHVDFAPVVSAVYVPVHSEYSDRVRRSYWNSAGEIREMVYRNMIEFDAEEYNWENVAEEEDMYFCEETGEFIHPIFFDSQDEAREVRASSSSGNSSEADAEDHLEYINEGRRMPVMQRR